MATDTAPTCSYCPRPDQSGAGVCEHDACPRFSVEPPPAVRYAVDAPGRPTVYRTAAELHALLAGARGADSADLLVMRLTATGRAQFTHRGVTCTVTAVTAA